MQTRRLARGPLERTDSEGRGSSVARTPGARANQPRADEGLCRVIPRGALITDDGQETLASLGSPVRDSLVGAALEKHLAAQLSSSLDTMEDGTIFPRLPSPVGNSPQGQGLRLCPVVGTPQNPKRPAFESEGTRSRFISTLRVASVHGSEVETHQPTEGPSESRIRSRSRLRPSTAQLAKARQYCVNISAGIGGVTLGALFVKAFVLGTSGAGISVKWLLCVPAVGMAGAAIGYIAAFFVIWGGLPLAASLAVQALKGGRHLCSKAADWLLRCLARPDDSSVEQEVGALEELGHHDNLDCICPISGARLENPVIGPCGVTYSRDAVAKLLEEEGEEELMEVFSVNWGMKTKLDNLPVSCPLELEEFEESTFESTRSFPVVASDGHTYNYRALVDLKKHHKTAFINRSPHRIPPLVSPVNRQPLRSDVRFQWALITASECAEIARLLPRGALRAPLNMEFPPERLAQWWRESA